MLSLKASRADNFYYNNVEDEKSKKKKEEIKKKKKKDYSEIKFEIPYTIICTKCDTYIYKGERFNSERRKVGYYISTYFYSFSIFCKNCFNKIIIETNPKNCSYDIIEGAKKKDENYKNIFTQKGINNINTIDLNEIKKKKVNPFLLLEKKAIQNKNALLYCNKGENNILSESEKDSLDKEKNETNEKKEEIYFTQEKKNQGKEYTQENFNFLSSDEDINDVIKENYKRNNILQNDFICNSNLRKQLREIKNDKIRKREEYKKKNIFIDIVRDPYEDERVKKYILLNEKYKKNIKVKKKFLKNHLITKRSSIFDKKYLR
ncbi:conserved Plasmodium protein, unknown function [Plasmodium gallinaceum]|uniref:CWC16 domain-containing protein n=1 Tax=Plasmodium gallinaceum TaxID=5849 RepID=A0A1J1GWP2_PLAGA|nr:conserved Plasmodium protein, unknown function [Plasmodium gallinaceum]CRG96961.1 conserved Plasmodium protein, unknown function [Plasmodium gallinaceum]